jgi:phosphate transport system protein
VADKHTSSQFDVELQTIRSDVLKMGGLVEAQVVRAIQTLKSAEAGSRADVTTTEQEINTLEKAIDEECNQVIAKRQPTAIDLRMLMAFVKTVNNLERIGDEAKKIARKAMVLESNQLTTLRAHDVGRMLETAREMLQIALDGLARLEPKAAADVLARDKNVDAEFQAIMRQIISYTMEDPRTISSALEIVLIAKAIERIGDHAKNIAESVVHTVKGKDVRHTSLEAVREEVQ